MNESTRPRTIANAFENPELTIAAGLLALGAATYAIESYLGPSLLLDGGSPATLAAVFGAFSLVYLAVFTLLRHAPPLVEDTL
jgi:hypothetical protein